MRGRGPDMVAVALSVTPAPTITTSFLSFKEFFSLAKTSLSRLATSLKASFFVAISCCQSLTSYAMSFKPNKRWEAHVRRRVEEEGRAGRSSRRVAQEGRAGELAESTTVTI